MVKYYILCLIFILTTPLFFYLPFRIGLLDTLQCEHHLSNSRMKKMKKGKRNFWWLESFHREFGFSFLYWGNQIATILYAVVAVLYLFLGYGSRVAFFAYAALMLLVTVLDCAQYIRELTVRHGTWLVLCRRKSPGRMVQSILFVPVLPYFGGAFVFTVYQFLSL